MALDDALGSGTQALTDDLMRSYQPADGQPYSTDPAVLTDRLARKLTPIGRTDYQPTNFSSKPEPEEKTPDLSSYGTPVEPPPGESSADLSSFGTEVKGPEKPLGVTGQLGAAAKGLLRGAPEQFGSILQGGAVASPMKPVAPEGTALIDQLADAPSMSASQRAKLSGQFMRTVGDRGLQMDFNAALQRIARGGDAAQEADALRKRHQQQNTEAAGPIQQQSKYKFGTRIKEGIDAAVPMTDQEKASIGGAVGTGVGGAVPYVAGALLGGPVAAAVIGGVGMGASTAGSTFEAAKAKGASDEDAAKAAGWGAAIGGTLGVLPLGVVLRPFTEVSSLLGSSGAAILAQRAVEGAAAFTTVGEAQEYLLGKVAQQYYDPEKGYSLDAQRVIANLITGALVGAGIHLATRPKPSELSSPEDIADFLRRAGSSRRMAGPEPMEGEVVPPRQGLPGPDGPTTPPPGGPDQGGPGPGRGGPGAAETPPKPQSDHQRLTEAGFSDQEIAEMSPRARAQRLAEIEPTSESDVGTLTPEQVKFLKEKGWTDKDITEHKDAPELREMLRRDVPVAESGTGKRDAPIQATTVDDVLRASEVVKEPTPAQATAENYQHGHLELPHLGLAGKHGVSIGTGVGQMRRSKDLDAEGKPKWEVLAPVPYGRIKGTKGADGQPLDIFIGPNPQSNHVFIVDQRHAGTENFDEHKILAGFMHPEGAMRAYKDSYADDAMPRIGAVTAVDAATFQDWLHNGDHTKSYAHGKEAVAEKEAATPEPITAPKAAASLRTEPPVPSSRGGTASEGTGGGVSPVRQELPRPKTSNSVGRSNDNPLSLTQFLASKGGLKPHGDLSAMDAHLKRVQIPGRRGFFGLVRDGGMALDEAREAAEEAGHLKGEHNKTSTERDLLDALDAELRGQKKMAEGEESFKTKREHAQDEEASAAARQSEIDHHHSTIEADADYRHLSDDVKDRAAGIMADEGLPIDDAVEQAAMRMVSEDQAYGVTPQLFTDTYGKEASSEIQPRPASGNGAAAKPKSEGDRQPGAKEEAQGHGEHVPDTGPQRGEEERAEPAAEHHQAIEDVLGPMAEEVLPVDITRAAELLAEHPDMPPELAFQHAVIENAADQGFLTVPELEESYGPEVQQLLEPERARASGGGEDVEQGRAEPRKEPASGGEESRVVPRGGQAGKDQDTADDQGEVDHEPNAGRTEGANAGREAVSEGEQPETAGGVNANLPAIKEQLHVDIAGKRYPFDGDYEKLSKAYSETIERTGSTVSGRTGPEAPRPLVIDQNGNVVAYVSYNGRVWKGDPKNFDNTKTELLYDPSGEGNPYARIGDTRALTQSTIPGTEPIGQGEQAQREADKPLKPTKAQQPADDGLFGDGHKQTDLLDVKPSDPETWWNKELTPFGRQEVLDATGVRGTPTIKWHYIPKPDQDKLLQEREATNGQNDARNGQHARTSGVGVDENAVQEPEAREVLRGRNGLPGMAGELPGVLRRDGAEADTISHDREAGEPQGLRAGQLRVGDQDGPVTQPAGLRSASDISGQDNAGGGVGRGAGDQAEDALSASPERLAGGSSARNASGGIGGDHGIQISIPNRDAGPEPADVPPPESGGRADEVRGDQGDRGAPPLPVSDQGLTEGRERPADDTGEARSGGTGPSADVRVPDRLGEQLGGREESPVQRDPAASVKGENYSIQPGALAEDRSPKRKAIDNIAAIERMQTLELLDRPARQDEQEQLARYVGWGGLKGAFRDADGTFASGMSDIGQKLQALLTPEEYDTARRSIQYAHYTAEDVIRAMWKAAEQLGFDGGLVFEPGMGVGHFAGMMPPDIAARSNYTGVEMDHVTARIAKLLYPNWGVRREDFTKMPLAENAFDIAIGNPPFADVVIHSDPKYAKNAFLLHDYFFAKSIDAVRPGGLLMFVTSAGTMNKIDPSARQYLADRAELVGAIRLPSNAFKKNAGTEVTTDIVMLRKRMPGEAAGDQSWTQVADITLPGPDGQPRKGQISKYFVDHPEMVLGKGDFADKLYEGRYSVKAWPNFDLEDALAVAIAKLPRNVMKAGETPQDRAEIDFEHTEKKSGTYYLKGAALMQMQGGAGVPVAKRAKGVEGGKSAGDIEKIRGLVPVRDALRETYAADLEDDKPAGERARKKLNAAYDAFVKQFGPINKAEIQLRRPSVIQQESARTEAREEARYAGVDMDEGDFDARPMIAAGKSLSEIARARREARDVAAAAGKKFSEGDFDPEAMPDIILDKRVNIEPFMDDPESYRLRAIEHYDDASGKASKGLVFTKNVITREKPPEIKSVNDAALYVLNQKGRLDLDQIGALVGKSKTETIEALGSRIYRVPGTKDTWETKEAYLSGNVRKKLAIAKKEADRDHDLKRNVTALEAAQPAPLAPAQIHANLGMPWIPARIIDQFAKEALELTSFKATYIPVLAQWSVSGDTDSVASASTWGTSRRNATALISDALNHISPKIYDEIDEKRVLNVAATQDAQDKQALIKEKFQQWIFEDDARADPLAELYNENYNNLVVREFDGSYLTTPGISADWKWRPHQTRAIARIIEEGNTYVAHAVGAGKTSVYIGAAMEMRRLGLVKKPAIVVPNHMLAQFTKEFYEQYPTARLAIADERNFHADRRKQFMANVALDDLDAIIITHTNFGMIPVSDQFNDEMIQTELDRYRGALADMPRGQDSRITRSRIEKQIERLEQRLSGKSNRRRDNVFTFDEMGIDFVFIDEAHEYRKLDFSTQMSNLKGITPEGSGKAWDLYVKSKLLEKRNPGRNLVLGSGTPVTNTMAELFTVSRYLQPNELAERQLSAFDAWAGAFGEEVSELEQDAAGGYKPVSRFAKFVNVAELSAMVRQVMDVVTSKQLEQYVVRPQLKGGKRIMNLAEKSVELSAYQDTLAARMVAIKGRGKPKPGDDIMLTIIGDGRHAAIDMRLVPGGEKSVTEPSKLDLLVGNVFDIWKKTKAQKFYKPVNGAYDMSKPADIGPATQMIFANLGLSGKRGLAVPDYIRAELVRMGVPRDQIAFISDYKTHVAKQKLFNDMNSGKVRVLIGSSAKMGTGVNAQRRLYANHNLDPLWYPADDEQRNGRIIRQGNMNPEIELHDYSTKGTYDSTMWGLMEKKARFIQGFFEGDPSMRDMEDLGEASQYAQAKAMTTNDPRLMLLTELKQDLERAERRKSAFESERYALKRRQANARSNLDHYSARVASIKQDIALRKDISGDNFKAVVGKDTFTDRQEFGEAVLKRIDAVGTEVNAGRHITIGEISGFPIVVHVRRMGVKEIGADLILKRSGNVETTIGGTSATGIARSIQSILSNFDGYLDDAKAEVAKAEAFLRDSEGKENERFKGQPEIDTLYAKVKDLEVQLAKKDETPPPGANPEVPPDETALGRIDTLTPAADAKKAELQRLLTQAIHKMVPNVNIEFRDAKFPLNEGAAARHGERGEGVSLFAGAYFPARHLIRVSLGGSDPTSTAFHEAYHAIEHLLQTAREHALMLAETPKLRKIVQETQDMSPAAADSMAGSEIRAIAFEVYRHNRERFGIGQGLHIGTKRWYHRLGDLADRVKNGLNGLGFQTADDIFAKAFEGGFADRQPVLLGTPYPEEMLAATGPARNPHNRPLRDSLGEETDAQLASYKERVIEGYQNLSRPVQKLEENIEARLSGELPDSQAFYQKKRLFSGKVAGIANDFNKQLLDPFVDLLKRNGIDREQAGDILYAMHAAERNREMDKINMDSLFGTPDMVLGRGSGMSNDTAATILSRFPPAVLAEIDQRAEAIRNFINNLMVESGLEARAVVEGWQATYEHYVPLSGWEDAPEEAPPGYYGGKFNVRGPEVRKAFGRTSKADNPLVNLIDQAYRTIERAMKNEYLQTLDNALHELDPDDQHNFVRFDQGKPKKELDRRTGLVRVVEDSNFRNEPGAVAFKRGGQVRYMIFENPQLADAIKRMHADGLGMLQPLITLQNKLKATWTHYSPEFLLRHFLFRYPIEGALNSFEQKESGTFSVGKYIMESSPLMGKAARAIFASNKGNTHTDPAIAELQRYWEEMKQAGGAMMFRQMRDTNLLREHMKMKLNSLTNTNWSNARAKWQASVEAMDTVTNALDNALRLAAYAQARKQGKTPDQAAIIARDATVDFQQSGRWKNIMSLFAPFSSVAINTGARMTSAIARSKIMRMVFGASILMGFLSGMFNYLIGGDDRDGIPFADKMAWWEKSLTFSLLNPYDRDSKNRPQPVHIPMPYNWALPLMIGQAAAAFAFTKDPHGKSKALAAVLKSGMEALTPFGAEHNKVAQITPELLRPFVHTYTNESWNGNPIHKDPAFQKGPRSESGRTTTGDGWKWAATGLNTLSGGDRKHSGALDVYPEDLREVLSYYTGTDTIMRFGRNVGTSVSHAVKGEEQEPSKIPFARVVRGTDYDAADKSRRFEREKENRQPWTR